MNIMGGDQFRQQQQSNGAGGASASEPKSSPAQPEKPKEVTGSLILAVSGVDACWRACRAPKGLDDVPVLMQGTISSVRVWRPAWSAPVYSVVANQGTISAQFRMQHCCSVALQ